MPSKSTKRAVTALALAAAAATNTHAFAPVATPSAAMRSAQQRDKLPLQTTVTCLWASTEKEVEEGDAPTKADNDDDLLEKAELLGRGSAKIKRGKRKGSKAPGAETTRKAAASLTPEEVYYEGPPAITETIAPTISILTVVGIIPAAAAWARQAWVRYKITTRRIRVTSGIGGKDMAEIVYPDIVEIRTAKRLFGDGDMVAFLRDGAKFEMRNIPNFKETMEFILKHVDKDVAAKYRQAGDVTNP